MKNRAGEFKKNLSGELQYSSFSPSPLPPNPPIEMESEIVWIGYNKMDSFLEELIK